MSEYIELLMLHKQVVIISAISGILIVLLLKTVYSHTDYVMLKTLYRIRKQTEKEIKHEMKHSGIITKWVFRFTSKYSERWFS